MNNSYAHALVIFSMCFLPDSMYREHSSSVVEAETVLYTRTLVSTANTLVYYFTSEIGTTSLQGTKWLPPKCPLFGGSTVKHRLPDSM